MSILTSKLSSSIGSLSIMLAILILPILFLILGVSLSVNDYHNKQNTIQEILDLSLKNVSRYITPKLMQNHQQNYQKNFSGPVHTIISQFLTSKGINTNNVTINNSQNTLRVAYQEDLSLKGLNFFKDIKIPLKVSSSLSTSVPKTNIYVNLGFSSSHFPQASEDLKIPTFISNNFNKSNLQQFFTNQAELTSLIFGESLIKMKFFLLEIADFLKSSQNIFILENTRLVKLKEAMNISTLPLLISENEFFFSEYQLPFTSRFSEYYPPSSNTEIKFNQEQLAKQDLNDKIWSLMLEANSFLHINQIIGHISYTLITSPSNALGTIASSHDKYSPNFLILSTDIERNLDFEILQHQIDKLNDNLTTKVNIKYLLIEDNSNSIFLTHDSELWFQKLESVFIDKANINFEINKLSSNKRSKLFLKNYFGNLHSPGIWN